MGLTDDRAPGALAGVIKFGAIQVSTILWLNFCLRLE